VSAYFLRHVSGVGTSKNGVDRVDGVHLSMTTTAAMRKERRGHLPVRANLCKISRVGKVRPFLTQMPVSVG